MKKKQVIWNGPTSLGVFLKSRESGRTQVVREVRKNGRQVVLRMYHICVDGCVYAQQAPSQITRYRSHFESSSSS